MNLGYELLTPNLKYKNIRSSVIFIRRSAIASDTCSVKHRIETEKDTIGIERDTNNGSIFCVVYAIY